VFLKLTAPGVPDIYQGAELWDLSLVDPDNRRPVDFESRRRRLCDMKKMSVEQILDRSEDGLPKLWTIRQSLMTRQLHSESFGAYKPLWAAGPKASHVIAFQRGEDVIAAAPRLNMSLGSWDTTVFEIPEGRWRNQFTGDVEGGGKLEMQTLLRRFPIALLTREP
jgi:(1->4)-alpha-D-glucan 1-alpha-D-glucosylmutase